MNSPSELERLVLPPLPKNPCSIFGASEEAEDLRFPVFCPMCMISFEIRCKITTKFSYVQIFSEKNFNRILRIASEGLRLVDHIQTAPQATQFATDNQIAATNML